MANLRRALLSTVSRILNSAAAHTSSISISLIPSQAIHRPYLGSISRLCSFNDKIRSVDVIDLSTEESKRLLFNRSKQRGFLELDLILGKWVEENITSMDESSIRSLVDVLDLENPDLWKWLTGQERPPETINSNPVFIAVRTKVMSNLHSRASPKTRATAGQPWVQGWDDFKKGRDSAVVGNQ